MYVERDRQTDTKRHGETVTEEEEEEEEEEETATMKGLMKGRLNAKENSRQIIYIH